MSQKESEWVEELKKVYDNESGNPRLGVMISFIEETLSSEREALLKELVEEVAVKEKELLEKYPLMVFFEFHKGIKKGLSEVQELITKKI